MKNQQRLIVGIVLALVLIIFALLNGQAVTVNFFGAMVHWPLIVVIVVAVLIGALIAVLITTTSNAKNRKALKQLQAEVDALHTDVDKQIEAATAPLKAENQKLQTQLKAKD
ncbi:LapA family protein [Lacticaseibacillus sp. GG6-2]